MDFHNITIQELRTRSNTFYEKYKLDKSLGQLTVADYNHIANLYLQNPGVLLEGIMCIKQCTEHYTPIYPGAGSVLYGFRVEKLIRDSEGDSEGNFEESFGNFLGAFTESSGDFYPEVTSNVVSLFGTFFIFSDRGCDVTNLQLIYQSDNLLLTYDDITQRWVIKFGYENENIWIVFETNPVMAKQLHVEV